MSINVKKPGPFSNLITIGRCIYHKDMSTLLQKPLWCQFIQDGRIINQIGRISGDNWLRTVDTVHLVLQVHRLPGHGPSVLLQHGLLCSSSSWLMAGRFSLAYILHRYTSIQGRNQKISAGGDTNLGLIFRNEFLCAVGQVPCKLLKVVPKT